jgi:macrolide-specific efflux system membrane fusion protein
MNVDGKRIRTLRLERSWSQETLAEQAGLSLRTVQRMEVEGIASLHSRLAVARALNVAAVELDAPTGGAPLAEAGDVDDINEPSPLVPDPEPRASTPFPLRNAVLGAGWILSMAAVALGTFHWTSRQRLDDVGPEPVETAVTGVATVGYGNIVRTVDARGTLRPRLIAPATARASGELVDVSVVLGDKVGEGQVLARLDASEQMHRVRSGELDLQMARNQLGQRELAVTTAENRLRQLDEADSQESGFERARDEARQELLDAQTALTNLRLQVEQHQVALERELIQLAYTEIRSPIAGTVVAIEQKAGAFIDARHAAPTVFQIADLTQLTAAIEVREGDVGMLSLGMAGEISTMGSSGRSWAGRIRQINPMPASRSEIVYSVLFDVDNADGALYPGMTVEAAFVTATAEDVLTVPVNALAFAGATRDTGNAVVELVLSDGSTQSRDVVVGIMNARDAEIVSGLAQGDRVVTRESGIPAPTQ